jgi:serine/threonine-protein phosphatase 4 regulatory subunit 1
MRKADEREERERHLGESQVLEEKTEDEDDYPSGLFGRNERKMFQDEILQQVVIGMGRLDASEEAENQEDVVQGEWDDGNAEVELPQQTPDTMAGIVNETKPRREDVVNPYFPMLSSDWADPSAASEAQVAASTLTSATTTVPKPPANASPVMHVSFAQLPVAPSLVASYQPDDQVVFSPDLILPNSQQAPPDPPIAKQERESKLHDEYHGDSIHEMVHGADIDAEVDEQAAVGRLSSMSLMAAVTASGMLYFDCRASYR